MTKASQNDQCDNVIIGLWRGAPRSQWTHCPLQSQWTHCPLLYVIVFHCPNGGRWHNNDTTGTMTQWLHLGTHFSDFDNVIRGYIYIYTCLPYWSINFALGWRRAKDSHSRSRNRSYAPTKFGNAVILDLAFQRLMKIFYIIKVSQKYLV